MHEYSISREIVERVLARRGRLRVFEELIPETTALIVVDMQNTFLRPGAPVEVPEAREIVPNINKLNKSLRRLGVKIIWVTHANKNKEGISDWPGFFDYFVSSNVREKTLRGLEPNAEGQKLWGELEVESNDIKIFKNRYSALIPGSSDLRNILHLNNIDTILIAGTKTNVCCESTARDAMMLDYKTVMLSDCCAALSEEEHRATLDIFFQQFGDVMTSDEILQILSSNRN